VNYYMALKRPTHPLKDLLYNYERYSTTLDEIEKDEQDRIALRLETGKRAKEWEEKIGNR